MYRTRACRSPQVFEPVVGDLRALQIDVLEIGNCLQIGKILVFDRLLFRSTRSRRLKEDAAAGSPHRAMAALLGGNPGAATAGRGQQREGDGHQRTDRSRPSMLEAAGQELRCLVVLENACPVASRGAVDLAALQAKSKSRWRTTGSWILARDC